MNNYLVGRGLDLVALVISIGTKFSWIMVLLKQLARQEIFSRQSECRRQSLITGKSLKINLILLMFASI
jgi:hypothetical protein